MPRARRRQWPLRMLWAAPLLLGLLAGCARPRSVGGYFVDRGRDFVECFRLSGGYAWGVHVRAQALIIEAGMGVARGKKYGWDGPGGVGKWHWRKITCSAWAPIVFEYTTDARGVDEDAALGPFLRPRFGDAEPPELPADLVCLRGGALVTGYNWRQQRRAIPKGTRVADLYWIEVDATVMPASLRVGFNPAQLIDWLAGFACLDMLGDDRWVVGRPSSNDVSNLAHAQ